MPQVGGAYFSYSEVFDRIPAFAEAERLLKDLDCGQTIQLLCQINTDLRLGEKDREAAAKLQQDICGGFLDDPTIERFKNRFGNVHLADRPVFHTPQVLLALKLAILNCNGLEKSEDDSAARYKIGTACLMLNDLLLSEKERAALHTGSREDQTRALMIQMLGPFEIINTPALTHVSYRSRIMFHILLDSPNVVERIRSACEGFDFNAEFERVANLSLDKWLTLLFSFYAYLNNYLAEDGKRQLEYLFIDRETFASQATFPNEDLDQILRLLSQDLAQLRTQLQGRSRTDLRFDFAPFKGRPLIEVRPNKFFSLDFGFLMDKMHSGVYWTIFDGAPAKRPMLFQAWGILFEEYVNWFLSNRRFSTPILFLPRPIWQYGGAESFDGAFVQDSRFVPMEYKGGFLKLEARYAGDLATFEADLKMKIAPACDQLARKIELLFHVDGSKRRHLRDIPTEHITRIIPVIVVQDLILRGPFVNWTLNALFNNSLRRGELRPDVVVDPVNVIGISELETMAESSEGGTFDILYGLQLRCWSDPEMRSDLQNFLISIPGYGLGKSERIVALLREQWEDSESYLFGQSAPDSGQSI